MDFFKKSTWQNGNPTPQIRDFLNLYLDSELCVSNEGFYWNYTWFKVRKTDWIFSVKSYFPPKSQPFEYPNSDEILFYLYKIEDEKSKSNFGVSVRVDEFGDLTSYFVYKDEKQKISIEDQILFEILFFFGVSLDSIRRHKDVSNHEIVEWNLEKNELLRHCNMEVS